MSVNDHIVDTEKPDGIFYTWNIYPFSLLKIQDLLK